MRIRKNLIFDVVIDLTAINDSITEEKIKDKVILSLTRIYPEFNIILTIDYQFY